MSPKTTYRNFSAFSVITVFILLSIVGAGLLSSLNISLTPSRSLPSITIRYGWHNASARVIESQATAKLEGMLNGIKGVQKIESQSSKSSGRITLSFKKDVDMDAAR